MEATEKTEQQGMRVGAIAGTNLKPDTMSWFGLGTFLGDEPCEMLGGMKNPKIQLDTGEIVWGIQCWWGPEAQILEQIQAARDEGAEIEQITVAEFSAACRAQREAHEAAEKRANDAFTESLDLLKELGRIALTSEDTNTPLVNLGMRAIAVLQTLEVIEAACELTEDCDTTEEAEDEAAPSGSVG